MKKSLDYNDNDNNDLAIELGLIDRWYAEFILLYSLLQNHPRFNCILSIIWKTCQHIIVTVTVVSKLDMKWNWETSNQQQKVLQDIRYNIFLTCTLVRPSFNFFTKRITIITLSLLDKEKVLVHLIATLKWFKSLIHSKSVFNTLRRKSRNAFSFILHY